MKLEIFSIFLLISFLLSIQCEKFKKIKEMLKNSQERFESEKDLIVKSGELEDSHLLKEILSKPLSAFNYHSTVTEYIGIKFEDIHKFTDHLMSIYQVKQNPHEFKDSIMDLFISDSNDVVVDKMLINVAYYHCTFVCFMGEKINKQKDSNWVVVVLTKNYFMADQVSVIKTDTSLWGYVDFQTTHKVTEAGKMSTDEIELLFLYFQSISLQRALEYFNLTS